MEITTIPVGKADIVIKSPDASHIHGKDGLGDASQFLRPVTLPKKALSSSSLLESLVKKYPDVQLLVTGPMTNIGALIKKKIYPARIIAMGGAVRVSGNVTPNAEFNISYDPEAADVVLNSPILTVLMPLDVTTQLIFTMHEFADIKMNHASS